MRTIQLFTFVFALCFFSCTKNQTSNETSEKLEFIKYVDPFIGTSGHGHTFPGATLPFGMVQLSPDNNKGGWDWSSGYHYSWDTIAGFSHTHLSGTGVGDMLDIAFMPSISSLNEDSSSSKDDIMQPHYASFQHKNEKAEPGYYEVLLDNQIKAELTCTKRAGFHKYIFPENSEAKIFIDLGFWQNTDIPYETNIEVVNDSTIRGYRFSNGWAHDQHIFFTASFNKLFSKVVLFDEEGNIVENKVVKSEEVHRKGVKAVLYFDTKKSTEVLTKVGISSVSCENALLNLSSEIPHWKFEETKKLAQLAWEEVLQRIKVESDNEELKTIFYTALYHNFIAPQLYSDVNGEYYSIDGKVKNAKGKNNYYTFSLWDTFRGTHPLYTIIAPNKVKEFVQAMMLHYEDYGILPVWSLWGNETYCMIGYHSIPVIVDAYFKGLLDEMDAKKLLEAMRISASAEVKDRNFKDLEQYLKHGYLPEDFMRNKYFDGQTGYTESASRTLEWAYDDWCIAQMAKAIGEDEIYNEFIARSKNYENIADKELGFMRPKNENGSWMIPFDPQFADHHNGFTEGNSWQYTWFVPHNIPWLIEFMGGEERFDEKLDKLFDPNMYDPEKVTFSDVSGLIGQYAHGNEPSHHVAYLYNYIGKQFKTAQRVRFIMDSLYTAKPDGLCGNEDCGQMSAWYVLSAMGFYPVNPANGIYAIGSPIFPKMTVSLKNGKTFEIIANNASEANIYVRSVCLNGKMLDEPFLSHKDIVNGGKLEFEMTSGY